MSQVEKGTDYINAVFVQVILHGRESEREEIPSIVSSRIVPPRSLSLNSH